MNYSSCRTSALNVVVIAAAAAALFAGCASDDQRKEAGITWGSDVDAALGMARSENRIVMIDFTATWCPPCHSMEDSTFSDPEVIARASEFLTVRVDVDSQRTTAEKYGGNARKYGGIGIPNILFLDKDGRKLKQVVGYHGPDRFIAVMDTVLAGT